MRVASAMGFRAGKSSVKRYQKPAVFAGLLAQIPHFQPAMRTPIPCRSIVIAKETSAMGHVAKEKVKLVNRLKRLRGQIEAIERAVEADDECAGVLQQATSCRGALDGFIAEVIEDHIREHMLDPRPARDDPRVVAAEELVDIVHAYLKK